MKTHKEIQEMIEKSQALPQEIAERQKLFDDAKQQCNTNYQNDKEYKKKIKEVEKWENEVNNTEPLSLFNSSSFEIRRNLKNQFTLNKLYSDLNYSYPEYQEVSKLKDELNTLKADKVKLNGELNKQAELHKETINASLKGHDALLTNFELDKKLNTIDYLKTNLNNDMQQEMQFYQKQQEELLNKSNNLKPTFGRKSKLLLVLCVAVATILTGGIAAVPILVAGSIIGSGIVVMNKINEKQKATFEDTNNAKQQKVLQQIQKQYGQQQQLKQQQPLQLPQHQKAPQAQMQPVYGQPQQLPVTPKKSMIDIIKEWVQKIFNEAQPTQQQAQVQQQQTQMQQQPKMQTQMQPQMQPSRSEVFKTGESIVYGTPDKCNSQVSHQGQQTALQQSRKQVNARGARMSN